MEILWKFLTAGHLVHSRPCPAAGHLDTANLFCISRTSKTFFLWGQWITPENALQRNIKVSTHGGTNPCSKSQGQVPSCELATFASKSTRMNQLWSMRLVPPPGGGDGGVLPYIGYIGMCHPKGYGFSAVLVINRVSILADFSHFGHK